MTFDLTKPVQTRDGRKARIICTDMKGGGQRIIALITKYHSVEEYPFLFNEHGKYRGRERISVADLINIPEEQWVNVYPLSSYASQEKADEYAGPNRIACKKFTVGEGL